MLKENALLVDINGMINKERRKYPRINSWNLIACYCLDETGNEFKQCMARAVEVSPVGVKLETFQEIKSEMVRLVSADSPDTLMDIKGRVVHSHKTEDGRYEFGICLVGTEFENTHFSLKLIAACQEAEPAFAMVKGARSDGSNRRKYPRIDTDNLISYSCLDENGNELDSSMARALDINPLGAKIETYQEILSENICLTSVDMDDNIIGIIGRVAHAHEADDGRYQTGIEFLGTREENTDFALKLISVFHKLKQSFEMVKNA